MKLTKIKTQKNILIFNIFFLLNCTPRPEGSIDIDTGSTSTNSSTTATASVSTDTTNTTQNTTTTPTNSTSVSYSETETTKTTITTTESTTTTSESASDGTVPTTIDTGSSNSGECNNSCDIIDPELSIECDENCNFKLKQDQKIAVYCHRHVAPSEYSCPDYGTEEKQSQGCTKEDADFLCKFLTQNPNSSLVGNFDPSDTIKLVGEDTMEFIPGFGCEYPFEDVDYDVLFAEITFDNIDVNISGFWYESLVNSPFPSGKSDNHPVHNYGNKFFAVVLTSADCTNP